MGLGYVFPFKHEQSSDSFFVLSEDEADAVVQNLRSLLTTNWGERVMRPDFGCNLREFMFEQLNDDLKLRISDRIASQVLKWMPFVSIKELNILYAADSDDVQENVIRIRIAFVLTSRPTLGSELVHDVVI